MICLFFEQCSNHNMLKFKIKKGIIGQDLGAVAQVFFCPLLCCPRCLPEVHFGAFLAAQRINNSWFRISWQAILCSPHELLLPLLALHNRANAQGPKNSSDGFAYLLNVWDAGRCACVCFRRGFLCGFFCHTFLALSFLFAQ